MINPMSLEGKKILVTGASSGIGRAVAIYCSRLGAQVILLGRNQERLEETRDAMCRKEEHGLVTQDLSKDADLTPLFDEMRPDGKKFDGLVHCAGISCIVPLQALSRNHLHMVMCTNFYSFIELSRFFAKKKYSNNGASIIGISSALTINPRKYELAYIASKAAMEAAVPVMAMECGDRKIRVNCIAPGNVLTSMIKTIMEEQGNRETLDAIASRSISGWQEPEDIAKVCAFLLSDASLAITAQVIRADGGFMQ